MRKILQYAKYIANICDYYRFFWFVFKIIFSEFFALRENFRKVFALHKIFHKYMRYFLRSAKNSAKICVILCIFLRSAKYIKNNCGIFYAVQMELYALSKNANLSANIYTSLTIPQFHFCGNTWDIASTYNIASIGVDWSEVECGVE